MADMKNILSLVATTSSRIKDLTIKDGQLVFIRDLGRIAFDFKGQRVFYNQIVELETEVQRLSLEEPLDGYYFVIDSAILWFYKDGWIQITNKPEEVISIGVELPELGQAKTNTLYVDKAKREISIYDSELNQYIKVSNYADEITEADIDGLFEDDYLWQQKKVN